MVKFKNARVNRFQCWLIRRGWLSPYVKRRAGKNITTIFNLSEQIAIVEWRVGKKMVGSIPIMPNAVHHLQGPKWMFRVRPMKEIRELVP